MKAIWFCPQAGEGCLGSGLSVLLALSLLIASQIRAQASRDDFDLFRQEADSAFGQFADSLQQEYDNLVARMHREFEVFKAEVDKKWDDHLYPGQRIYVQYGPEFRSRASVDFEHGVLEASAVIDMTADTNQLAEARGLVEQKVAKVIAEPGGGDPFQAGATTNAAGTPLLEGQVADARGSIVTAESAPTFARELVQSQGVSVDTVRAGDGVRRIRLSVSYSLVPNQLKVRAERYLILVRQYAAQFGLDPRLVLAIMHTESYFNPRAVSQIPAFGLMQIVPGTAGRDAYRHVFGEDRLVTADYLYDPQRNIELGCAYLSVLREKYLRGVSADQKAYPCMIASYNGGIGTVCQAMVSSRSLTTLSAYVESIEYSEVVSKLKAKLPYQETRDYLTRVLDRMPLYDEWAK